MKSHGNPLSSWFFMVFPDALTFFSCQPFQPFQPFRKLRQAREIWVSACWSTAASSPIGAVEPWHRLVRCKWKFRKLEAGNSGSPWKWGPRNRSISSYYNNLLGGLEHLLFSPIVGMMIHFDQYFSGGLKPPISNKFVYDTQITIFKWGYKPTYNLGGASCTVSIFLPCSDFGRQIGETSLIFVGGIWSLIWLVFWGIWPYLNDLFRLQTVWGLADLIWGWSWILTTKLVMDFEQQSLDDLKPGKLEISTKKMEWGISHNSGIGRKTWNNRLNHGILRITWKWDSWFNPKVNKFEFADSTGYRIVDFNSCWWILSSKNHGFEATSFLGIRKKGSFDSRKKSASRRSWGFYLILPTYVILFCNQLLCMFTIQRGDLRQQQWWFTMIEQTMWDKQQQLRSTNQKSGGLTSVKWPNKIHMNPPEKLG